MSDTLDLKQVRENIDALDDKIHDLLMERAELIREVSAIKRKSGRPIVHPAREASMLRRLLGRHAGILPQAAIIGIWRELVGGVSMLQRGLHAYVYTQPDQQHCWDMAKDYCGSVIPMTRVSEAVTALNQVRDDIDSVAVLPWPEEDQASVKPWWTALADEAISSASATQEDAYKQMRIIAALPFGRQEDFDSLERRAVFISRMEYLPSGEDHSFVIVKSDTPISRGLVIDAFEAQGYKVLSLKLHNASEHEIMALVEVKAYISADDQEKLDAIKAKIPSENARCLLIGGYPVPPKLRSGDTDPAEL